MLYDVHSCVCMFKVQITIYMLNNIFHHNNTPTGTHPHITNLCTYIYTYSNYIFEFLTNNAKLVEFQQQQQQQNMLLENTKKKCISLKQYSLLKYKINVVALLVGCVFF